MNDAGPASPYDSSSSRWQAPHAGAALKSINSGLFCSLARAKASSASVNQFMDMAFPPYSNLSIPMVAKFWKATVRFLL